MKDCAVIILNWNGLELLKQFLPEAARHTISERADLIVADNGSTDGSVEWIRENHPEVITLSFSENLGFSGGYNKAIELTKYPLTLLLNSDVEVTPGWLKPLIDYMDQHLECGALQPKIRSFKHKEMFEYAGAAGGYLDKNGYPFCRGRLFDVLEKDSGQYDSVADVAWASGAALLVRTDAYIKAGGLDEKFFAHMEEIDLCLRIRAMGRNVVCVPTAVVYHVGGASLAQGNPKKTYLNFRNNLLLLHKNLPRSSRGKRLVIRRLYDTLAWGMFLLKGDFKNARAVLKAHNDFRKLRKEYTSEPATDVFASLPGTTHNIITEHYIKRKNKIII
ncbi:MAG: glycosyltransferase family 2 protein [Prevotella sp.]|nr:glycosyltransferase family 2 protein [Prevotella sp.]MCM1074913.1 glycosyltransferase family 2 protein [Ruminococcus sp.]